MELYEELKKYLDSLTEEEKEQEFEILDMEYPYGLDYFNEEDRKKYKWIKRKERIHHGLRLIQGVLAFIIPVVLIASLIVIETTLTKIIFGVFLIIVIFLYILFRDNIFPEEIIKRR